MDDLACKIIFDESTFFTAITVLKIKVYECNDNQLHCPYFTRLKTFFSIYDHIQSYINDPVLQESLMDIYGEYYGKLLIDVLHE